MSKLLLKNQIIDWLKTQPYWFQFAGNLLLEGSEINDNLIDGTYTFFKEAYRLKETENKQVPIVFNEITIEKEAVSSNLNLLAIQNIENVNALATGQSIEINKNLTIIYGNNGSGKSGYIRLLNNAFNSRGDKNILSNVFTNTINGPAKCEFVFQSTGDPYKKSFPLERNSFEFSKFDVFDSQSVKVHLDNDNQLNFTPNGFDFFEKVLQLFEELKARINSDILKSRPQNNFIIHFQNENEFKYFIQSLGAQTNEITLKKLSDFTPTDNSLLEEIKTKIGLLKALNIQEQITGFEKLQRELSDFMQQQQSILSYLTKDKIDFYLNLIDTFHKLQTVSKAEGIKSLEQYSIEQIGSQLWRDFIIAAKNYTNNIDQQRVTGKEYPTESDRCIFCLQPLSGNETTLINTYWQLLRSQAENEFNKIKQNINDVINDLNRLNTVKFDESTNLFGYLNKLDPELTIKWKELVAASELIKNNIIKNLENLNKQLPVNQFTANTNEFDKITLHIKKEIDTLFAKKPDQEIATLNIQLNYLTDKSLLSKLLPQISTWIKNYKWALTAENSISALRTNSLTSFQGSLFNQHITIKYKETFNSECRDLKAPPFVEIEQQNNKLKTYRKLLIARKAANQILSEGEQHAISLADFLTEVQLNPNNRGVIFDDPVNSLDHQRRALIAERLVKLSKSKQVIIFTHDIAFFSKVTLFAKSVGDIPVTLTTMRRIGDSVGIIRPDLPWVAQKVKDRVAYLRNSLVRLKTLEKNGEEEEYNIQIKGWYGLLREAWERCVEERLFKGAIERFSGEVHTKPLKSIEITPELVAMIDDGMTQSSNWVHDQAMGLNPPIPDSAKADIDFELLFKFSEMCKTST